MKCWHCKDTELIWGCDHDAEAYGCEDIYTIVSNLHCPNCGCDVYVYLPKENDNAYTS